MAAVTKAKADFLDLGRLRGEDMSAKTAAIRECDLVQAEYDEKIRVN